MNNAYFLPTPNWVEMDAYSNEELSPAELQLTIGLIQKSLHDHLVEYVGEEKYYSLDVKLFVNKDQRRFYHLIANVQIFPLKRLNQFVVSGPGNGIFAMGVPVIPPKPNPPAPFNNTILHPLSEQFNLSAHLLTISSKLSLADSMINTITNINAVTL